MEDRSFYVYAHYRLDTMEPFYIGKGREGRANKLNRNSLHDNISKKHGHAVVILYDNLTEEEAFFYEREVIEDLVYEEGYEIYCNNIEVTKQYSYLTNFTFGGEGTTGHNPLANKTGEEIEKIREKQSIANKKRLEDKKEREKISVGVKKHYKSPEAREKLSKAQRKRYEDTKEREKCSLPGEKSPHAKSVYCNELNILFSYIGIAKKYCINVLNSKISTISRICNGERKYSGKLADGTKLTWNWVEDVDKETLDKAEYIDDKKYEEILSQNVNVCK